MVRAILEHGEIRPLVPLPPEWSDGQPLVIEAEPVSIPEDSDAWIREIDEAAARIPEAEHARFLAALDEQRRVSKEHVRRLMGLG
jgi:hypothetical protein